jgi:hypothetical protein
VNKRSILRLAAVVVVGGVLVWLGWFLAAQGLERANQLSGVLGLFIGLVGLGVALYGVWQARMIPKGSLPNTSAADLYLEGLLGSGIQLQGSAQAVLQQALESAWRARLLTADHLAVALLQQRSSSWRAAVRATGTDPEEVIALLMVRIERTTTANESVQVTDTVRAVMKHAAAAARTRREPVDERQLAVSLLTKAERLAGYLEQDHKYPVGAWLHSLRTPGSAILTPEAPPERQS